MGGSETSDFEGRKFAFIFNINFVICLFQRHTQEKQLLLSKRFISTCNSIGNELLKHQILSFHWHGRGILKK